MLDNPESMAIVNTIARLGDSLNLPTTAEGIEDRGDRGTPARVSAARKAKDIFMGRPLGTAQVRRLLAEKRLAGATAGP